MHLGFNSDVGIGGESCHVQTEDHGPPQCYIETLVFLRGRILHRRTMNYLNLISSPGQNEASLRGRVEAQHRAVVDGIRSGAIPIDLSPEGARAGPGKGIQVRLNNAHAWRVGAQADLEVQVLQKGDGQPFAGLLIEAFLDGAGSAHRSTGRSDSDGRARLSFAVGLDSLEGRELVIRAQSKTAADEIRYFVAPEASEPPRESRP